MGQSLPVASGRRSACTASGAGQVGRPRHARRVPERRQPDLHLRTVTTPGRRRGTRASRVKQQVARLGHPSPDHHDAGSKTLARSATRAQPAADRSRRLDAEPVTGLGGGRHHRAGDRAGSPPAASKMVAAVGDSVRRHLAQPAAPCRSRTAPSSRGCRSRRGAVRDHPDVTELARDPVAPRNSSPASTMPPPMPVPSATISSSSTSGPRRNGTRPRPPRSRRSPRPPEA